MNPTAYFTPATRPSNYTGGRPYRAGATWVYAESPDVYLRGLSMHVDRLEELLRDTILATSGDVTLLVRTDSELCRYEKQYLHFLANSACKTGTLGKMFSRSAGEAVYASYFTSTNTAVVHQLLGEAVRMMATGGSVRFTELARSCFGRRKGSYYWAKGVCEHLVYLGLARHSGRGIVRGPL